MPAPIDWLSQLLEIVPVGGRLDLRCLYGAPWRIEQKMAAAGEIPYHVVVAGTAVLDDPQGGPPDRLGAGDILLLPDGAAHVLHDESGAPPLPAHERPGLNFTISESAGPGERLELICGHFAIAAPHDRLIRDYLPRRLIVRAAAGATASAGQLTTLMTLMRQASAAEGLGGRAMLNGLSAALFAVTLRVASESEQAPAGLLALAGHSRLAPALSAMFQTPAHPWSLPELARLCNMSRATMARHFQDRLKRSPAELLTGIRMALAAKELHRQGSSTAAVAEAVGYRSEAAFQRAFKQAMAMTPAQWRRLAQAPDPDRSSR
jgi:AraC family transcriptional activator of mtrCDE